MNSVTIPKELTNKGDLVVISRKEYEAFSKWQKMCKMFTPTAQEKTDLKRARVDYKLGRTMTINELKRKLASNN